MRKVKWSIVGFLIIAAAMLTGCGFQLRRSAALPAAMQQRVFLQVNGGGGFPRSLAAALRARKVEVLDAPAKDAATLSVPVAAMSSRLLTTGGFQRVGEYRVDFNVQISLTDADGRTLVPVQSIDLAHEFAVDQTQLSAIASETEAIERSLVREMTDAVMRRLEAQARTGTLDAPAGASSAG